ncbi:MAG: hypothetical protein ACOYL8_03915 [Patescibacteria group bacterium]
MNETSYDGPKRILFLDTDYESVNAFRKLAVSLSFPSIIIAAGKTSSAIDLLENNDFDLIISQIFPTNMINGLVIVERLRNGSFGDENKNIPAIAHTAKGYIVKEACIEVGFNDYVATTDDPKYKNKLLKAIEDSFVSIEVLEPDV